MTTKSFGLAMLVAGTVACALPLLGASDDASAVLARHKAFMGWAYGDGTLNSIRETIVPPAQPAPGSSPPPPTTTNDPEPTRSDVVRRGLLYRFSGMAHGHSEGDQGFTGSVFWRSSDNGFTVTVRGHDATLALTEDVIESEAFAEVPSALRPATTFDEKRAAVVRISPQQGVPADLFFGEDGALLGYTLDPADAEESETVHIVSYGEFAPHKRYAVAVRYGDSRGTYHIVDVQPNAPVSDADLHPPAPRATWTFGEPHTVPITIRHGTYAGTAVYVDVVINGHTGQFLLDSGAGGTLLSDHFARAAKLEEIGQTAFSGVNGAAVAATTVKIATISIGGSTLHNVIAERAPPLVQGEREDSSSDGIIGYDLLAAALVDVDLSSNRLTILDPREHQPVVGKGAYAFPLDLSYFHAGVPLKLGSDVLPSVWIDTGNAFFVILPKAMEQRHVATITNKIYFNGVDGISEYPADCARFSEVQIGPYRYQNALSCFAPNEAFGKGGGLIGFDFLKHFNWTFDYPHGQLVLTPNGM